MRKVPSTSASNEVDLRLRKFSYSWKALSGDFFGGLIAALIALPYGLAMATLMGLPPILGIFTSLLTCPITFLLGRNPVLIGGTATVTVPFIAKAVSDYGLAGAAKISLIASIFMMIFSVLRWGRYILQVPATVVSGFSCGIGAMMVVAQLKTIFGLAIPNSATQLSTLAQFWMVLERIDGFKWPPFVLGVTVIAVAFFVAGRSKMLPAPLLGVLASVGIGYALGLHEKIVGRLPLEMPPLASFVWTPADLDKLLLPGLGLAFVTSVNLLITSRVVDHFRGWHKPMKPSDADGELGAYGIANVCAGMFGAPISVGIPARSLAIVRCGGTTRVSNLIHGLILLATLYLGSEYVSKIPLAALAGVTAYVGICLLEWSTWKRLRKMRRIDAAAFLVTCLSVLVVNAVIAVGLGCSLYGLRWVYARYFVAPPQTVQKPA
jgi:SulP family sulfate permease